MLIEGRDLTEADAACTDLHQDVEARVDTVTVEEAVSLCQEAPQ